MCETRTDQAHKMLRQTLCRCVVNSSFEQHRIQTQIVSYQFCMASSDVFSKRIKTCPNSSLLVSVFSYATIFVEFFIFIMQIFVFEHVLINLLLWSLCA